MKARIPNQGPTGANMMKKLQEVQSNMSALQDELAAAEYNASAGGGAVEVTVNGSHEIKAIKSNPRLSTPKSPKCLRIFLMASLNEAMRKPTKPQSVK